MSLNSFDDRKKLHKCIERMALACDRKIADEQADEYFRQLCHFRIDDVDLAIDNIISIAMPGPGGYHAIPMPAEIIAEIKRIKSEQAMSVVPEWCPTCNRTGMVVVEFKDRQPLAYRCACKNGQRTDRGLRAWDEVKAKYEVPEDMFPPKLPLFTIDTIKAMPEDQVLEDGCEVSKLCDTCKGLYMFRHERRMTKKDLTEFHINNPAECEPCLIERGRRAGLWT